MTLVTSKAVETRGDKSIFDGICKPWTLVTEHRNTTETVKKTALVFLAYFIPIGVSYKTGKFPWLCVIPFALSSAWMLYNRGKQVENNGAKQVGNAQEEEPERRIKVFRDRINTLAKAVERFNKKGLEQENKEQLQDQMQQWLQSCEGIFQDVNNDSITETEWGRLERVVLEQELYIKRIFYEFASAFLQGLGLLPESNLQPINNNMTEEDNVPCYNLALSKIREAKKALEASGLLAGNSNENLPERALKKGEIENVIKLKMAEGRLHAYRYLWNRENPDRPLAD
ncbi:MAG: hypothetical protein SP4CHLAM5_02650 [Chlamydiia bacterium]|nr:hypothetical protein [Chlamydiia bacterium]MCH9618139.1 hypothetical protein [Chlamydiia bacterium]MCH9624019.1 hypothetical protein [Chlamydiia bacterium]